ncbi:DNA-binding response regulator [Photobacterium ganghwense]|uniref:Transcriptional regulator n=1 Tax=Photobacterium ganghwense TaxID=320778 RepID=A0A0J1K0V0_9GAMM|nr:response regulator [Photobacterium ganghwense]KLV08102.1 transcriptional regulator [Photobacterium ganghwense]PSU07222.1 DNA-binding response regulator [Photobacterium ganghwense]QSV15974.1 response regulator [Photobacterium ganghwense]
MNVLLIEDDRHIARFIAQGFCQEGYTVELADNGVDGLHLATTEQFDLIVLDIMLPQKDGLEVLTELRGMGYRTPVIILSARHSVEERVLGLKSGADDYMVKPFAFTELAVRCQILTRRDQAKSLQSHQLSYQDLTLDVLKRTLFRAGQSIQLNQREFSLMKLLMEQPETVLSKTTILEQVWGYQFDPQTNVVDVLVCRLRVKVDRDFEEPLIHTIRGVGYVLKSEY